MDLDALIATFIFGGVLGGLVKFIYDVWASQIAWKRELQTNTRKKIETQASNYRLMSNYAELFSDSLNKYLKIKSNLQMISIQPVERGKSKNTHKNPYNPNISGNMQNKSSDELPLEKLKYSPKFNPIYSSHLDKADRIAKISLFHAGKFLKILSKHFLEKGGDYFFPDWWAVNSIEDLHHALDNTLPFNQVILLKYIEEKDEPHDFFEKLDDNNNQDLIDLYDNYRYWLFFEDLGVRELSHYAEAYDDIFDKQIDKFYRLWFEKRDSWRDFFRRRNIKKYDPQIDKGTYLELKPQTSILIKILHKNKEKTREKWEDLKLSELYDDTMLIRMNSLFNAGWKNYCREEYQLAIDSQNSALDMLEKWYSNCKYLRYAKNVYTRKKAKIFNSLGNVYINRGIVRTNVNDFKNAKRCFREAELNYKRALKYNKEDHVIYLNFAILYELMGEMHYKEHSFKTTPSQRLQTIYNALDRCDMAVEEYEKSIKAYNKEQMMYRNLSSKYRDIAYIYYYIGRAYSLKVDLLKKLNRTDSNAFEEISKDNPEVYENAFKESIENYRQAIALKREDTFKKSIENYRQAISLKPTEYIFYMYLSETYSKNSQLNPKNQKLAGHYYCKGLRKIENLRNSTVNRKSLEFYTEILSKYCKKLKNQNIPESDGAYYRECRKAKEICEHLK